MRRTSRLLAVASGLAITALLVTGCGSSKKSDDTSAATTEAATTEATATEATATEATTTDAATTEAAAGEALVTQMISGMNGGATPDPADVKCVTSKVSAEELAKLISSSSAGAPTPEAMTGLIKATFQCKPKGLADSLITSAFSDMPTEVTPAQKTCMADKFLDTIVADDATLTALLAAQDKPPAELLAKFDPVVKDCVPAGATRDKLLAELRKS
jgi:hypothetical protein